MTPTPGELLLHPLAIASAAALVINDHWLKHSWPSAVTGKLSDFVGLILFPLLLASLAEFFRRLIRRDIVAASDAIVFPTICGLGFIIVKCTALGNEAYAWSVGIFRWPYQAFTAALHNDAMPGVQPILVARDATDLLALLVLPLPYILIRARLDNSYTRPVSAH